MVNFLGLFLLSTTTYRENGDEEHALGVQGHCFQLAPYQTE